MSKPIHNLCLNGQISRYISSSPEETSSIKKISRIVDHIFRSLSRFLNTIDAFLNSAINHYPQSILMNRFFSKVIVRSENRGKFSDLKEYVHLANSPATLNTEGREVLRGFGCSTDEITLSPKLADNGKCFGAVNLFIDEYLSSELEDIEGVAKRFKGGVPLEGVLNQELYHFLNEPGVDEAQEKLGWSIVKILAIGMYDAAEHQNLPQEHQHILKEVHYLVSKQITNDLEDIVEYVKLTYSLEYKKDISDQSLSTLRKALNGTFGLPRLQLAMAQLNGLDVEDTLWGDNTEGALDTISSLPPGAYSLNLPAGTARHVISLIIQPGRFTYLYDPNFGIGRLDDPVKSVGRLIRFYAPKPGILSRIKKVFQKAKYHSSESPSPLFYFCKYKKVQQL